MSEFKVEKDTLEIYPGEYCIRDYYLDNYYLIVGEEKACLIDTGAGIGDPWLEIRNITDKPVMVLLTHGHLDHFGNSHHFDEVYMSEKDNYWIEKHYGKTELINWFIETRGPVRFPGEGNVEGMKSLVPETLPESFSYININDGDEWDLGGVTIHAIHTPGHTPGSMSFLSSRSGYLYAGDALNKGIIIPNKPEGTRAEILEMAESLRNLTNYYDEIDKVCMGHDGPFINKQIIRDYLVLCEGLIDGRIVGEYEEEEIRAGKVVRRGFAEFWYEADR